MTVNIRKKKLTFGYIAPCALLYHRVHPAEIPVINQYDGKMVVLISIWKTRCVKPRFDIVIWLPWQADGHRIVLVKGTSVANFLNRRYNEPTEAFDVKAALRYVSFSIGYSI